MSVYVDNGRSPLGRMIMCHMVADSDDELHAMAAALGLRRSWHQRGHYDISRQKRAKAVALGAVEITLREAVAIRKRTPAPPDAGGEA